MRLSTVSYAPLNFVISRFRGYPNSLHGLENVIGFALPYAGEVGSSCQPSRNGGPTNRELSGESAPLRQGSNLEGELHVL